jgi:hypothetical protein
LEFSPTVRGIDRPLRGLAMTADFVGWLWGYAIARFFIAS